MEEDVYDEKSRLLRSGSQRSNFDTRRLIKGELAKFLFDLDFFLFRMKNFNFSFRVRFFYCDIYIWMWMLELCLPLVSLWTDFKYFIGHFPDTFWPHGKRDFIMEWDFTIPKLSKSEFTSKFILFFFSIKPSNQYLIFITVFENTLKSLIFTKLEKINIMYYNFCHILARKFK